MFPSADCLHFALYYFRLYSEPRSRAQWMRDSTHTTPPPRIVAPSPWYLIESRPDQAIEHWVLGLLDPPC